MKVCAYVFVCIVCVCLNNEVFSVSAYQMMDITSDCFPLFSLVVIPLHTHIPNPN